MLSFPAAIKVYLCTVACDMRRSFDGLLRIPVKWGTDSV